MTLRLISTVGPTQAEHVTTAATLAHDLRESLRLRGIAVRTWGEFIDAVESLGVRREDRLGGIEFGIAQGGTGRVTAEWDPEGEWHVLEVR